MEDIITFLLAGSGPQSSSAAGVDADAFEATLEDRFCGSPAAQSRFVGLYLIRNCSAAAAAGGVECAGSSGGYAVQRWGDVEGPEGRQQGGGAVARMNGAADDWQGDVHTVLCSQHWQPLIPDLAEAVAAAAAGRSSAELLGDRLGGGSDAGTPAAAALAAEVCAEVVCGGRGGGKHKKKTKKQKQKKQKAKGKGTKDKQPPEPKKSAKSSGGGGSGGGGGRAGAGSQKVKTAGEGALGDLQQKIEAVKKARAGGRCGGAPAISSS